MVAASETVGGNVIRILISLVLVQTGVFAQDLILSPEQQRRKDDTLKLLGDQMSMYFQSEAQLITTLTGVPSLKYSEPGYLSAVAADLADIPRKLVVEGQYQQHMANGYLLNLGFKPNSADKIWTTVDGVVGVALGTALDPNVIKNAFESQEARSMSAQ